MRSSLKKIYIISGLIILVVGFSLGFYIGIHNSVVGELVNEARKEFDVDKSFQKESLDIKDIIKRLGSGDSSDIDFDLYGEVWDAVKKYHINNGTLSDSDLFYGSLKGIIDSLDDPYSTFFDPEQAKQFTEDISGKFEGVGIHIGERDDRLTVIAPLKGSPAEKSGILAGDNIFSIDGFDTTGISIDEAVMRIRGEKGTNVTLTIYREGLDDLKDIIVTRDTIVITSVSWEKLVTKNKGNYFILKLSSFNDGSYEELNTALLAILKENPSGIVLDLRNNPGGLLDLAIRVSSLWIEDGVIVTESFSDGRVNKSWADGMAVLEKIPTVVLINQGSASASEIVAGALQDYNKALILGTQSFGKGSVQSVFDFNDGSAAKITIAKWLTPKNREIENKGITPDILVPLNFEDFNAGRDPQLDKAIEMITLPLGRFIEEVEKEVVAAQE